MGYNLLNKKKGIIFGALNDESIAWKVCESCYKNGADIVLTNSQLAIKRVGAINDLAKKTKSNVIGADATSMEDLENLFTKAMEYFGSKIDFVLHSVAMSKNIRKKNPYTELNYEWLKDSWDISAVSFHKVLQAGTKLDAFNKGASIVALTYIGAQRSFSNYSDMSDHKAYLESVARNFGYHLGKKKGIRINTVSQSPTPTTAGKGIKGFDKFVSMSELNSPLGNASAEECGDYIVTLFSDLTKKVTMQNLFHDGGFSSTGFSDEIMDKFEV